LQRIFLLIICFLTGSFLISCVTTSEGLVHEETVPEPEEKKEEVSLEKNDIIFSSRDLATGPLLLGSKEHMSGPVVEFSILYSLYFPLSGILTDDHQYDVSQGTRWQINSEKFEESVFFERALLNEDSEGRSWWYFMVEGDGFRREYEFLLDEKWSLMEMHYFADNFVMHYTPSVDENRDLSNGSVPYDDFHSGREKISVEAGEFQSDHIVLESSEHWTNKTVPGSFVKSILLENEEIILTASVVEIKKDYHTIMNSY